MAEFSKAFANVIELEGGFVDHPNDPGGATNFGISLRFLKATNDLELGDMDGNGTIDFKDIKLMTIQDAARLYKKYFWDAYNYVAITNQAVANKIFDMCVNMGANQAHKLLQSAINSTLGQLAIKSDGILGPKTGEAMSLAMQEPYALLVALRSHQEGFYKILVKQNSKFVAFKEGWLKRALS